MGTSRPLEHLRPGIVRRLAASDKARALFSTACHFPYELARRFVAVAGSLAGGTSFGLSPWAAKIIFEAGNKIPLISWARFAETRGAGAAAPPLACAGA